jgi:TusA-related sulfurtransferase
MVSIGTPVLDVRGLGCGSVLVQLAAHRRTLTETTEVIVWTDDLGAPEELPSWCRLTSQQYIGPIESDEPVVVEAAKKYVLILSPRN